MDEQDDVEIELRAPSSATGETYPVVWGSALLAGGLCAVGALTPYVSSDVASLDYLIGWSRSVPLAASAALFVGGGLGLVGHRAAALAGGAATAFLGLFAVFFRNATALLDLGGSGIGSDLTPDVGLFAWTGAAVLSAIVAVGSLPGLGEVNDRRTGPCVVMAGGILTYWAGLVVPPSGVSIADHLFAGDTASDAAVLAQFATLPAAAVVLLAHRTASSLGFALGVACPWAASWLVFAYSGELGGLPVAWPDRPAVAAGALAVVILGGGAAFVPGLVGAGSTVAAGSVLAGTSPVVLMLCAGGVLVVGTGAATADAVPVSGLGRGGSTLATIDGLALAEADPGSTDTDLRDLPAPDTSGGSDELEDPVGTGDGSLDEFATEECVRRSCERATVQSDLVDDLIVASGSEGFTFSGTGQWIAQLQANSLDSAPEQTRRSFDLLDAEIPGVKVVLSDDFGSMTPGYITFFHPGPFASADDALRFCRRVDRFDPDLCFARFLSDDPADRALDRYPG